MKLVFVCVSVFLLATPCRADWWPAGGTAYDMLNDCKQADIVLDLGGEHLPANIEMSRVLHCLGYVQGFIDGAGVTATLLKNRPGFCLPPTSNTAQMIKVFIKLAAALPEQLHEPAGYLLSAALLDAFPCK